MKPTGSAVIAGVTGSPIAHSLSPILMARWIKAQGINAQYIPLEIKQGNAQQVFRSLALTSMSGVNVTLPFKSEAIEVADKVSETANAIGAANLLTFRNGLIFADNTDAAGFLIALDDAGVSVKSGPALVLGAGGAARAIVYALKQAGAPHIQICNRTTKRAEDLAFDLAPDSKIITWENKNKALCEASIVINTTSMGMKGENDLTLDWSQVSRETVAVDIVYTPLQTRFLKDAVHAGLKGVNGLGMLIGQARPSFKAFFGVDAPADDSAYEFIKSILENRS